MDRSKRRVKFAGGRQVFLMPGIFVNRFVHSLSAPRTSQEFLFVARGDRCNNINCAVQSDNPGGVTMKKGKIFRMGWLWILLFTFSLCAGNVQADEPIDEIINLTNQLESLKDQADVLLDQVRGVTDPSELPPLWTQAMSLEEQALPIIQQGIDLAQTVSDPSDIFQKKIIIFEYFHVKLIVIVDIVKLTIIQLIEEFAVPQGPPEPIIDYIIASSDQLQGFKDQAAGLIDQIRMVGSPEELPPLWAEALSLEEQVIPIVQEVIDSAQTVSEPTELLQKKIIIFEHWHIKVIQVIAVAKLLVLQFYEEFSNPVRPPDSLVIDQVVALTTQLENLEGQANYLIDQIGLVTDPGELPPLWAQALSLEEQSLPILQEGIDAVQTVDNPSELLVKKVIIFGVWIDITVTQICISELLILQLLEEFGVPQGPPEPLIGEIIALSDQLEDLDHQADNLMDQIRAAQSLEELPPLFAQGLYLQEQALPIFQQGIDLAQTVSEPTQLLIKKIIILEQWFFKLVAEICVCELIIIQLREEMQPTPPGNNFGLFPTDVLPPLGTEETIYVVEYQAPSPDSGDWYDHNYNGILDSCDYIKVHWVRPSEDSCRYDWLHIVEVHIVNLDRIVDDGDGHWTPCDSVYKHFKTPPYSCYTYRYHVERVGRWRGLWVVKQEYDPLYVIPTLAEWGLIVLGVVLLGFITWVFLRRRRALVSLQ